MGRELILARNLKTLEAAKKALKDPKLDRTVRREITNLTYKLHAQNHLLQRNILSSGKTAGSA